MFKEIFLKTMYGMHAGCTQKRYRKRYIIRFIIREKTLKDNVNFYFISFKGKEESTFSVTLSVQSNDKRG